MEYDREKLPHVHCFLDIARTFIEKVPIKDETWDEYRRDALYAINFVSEILRPFPEQPDPCKGRPIQQIVEPLKMK